MRRKRPVIVAFLVSGLLLGGAVLCAPWFWSEVAVRKIIADPSASLSDGEAERIQGYIYGDKWHRLPGAEISPERQEQLVEAVVSRVMRKGEWFLFGCVANRWNHEGSFPTLPGAVGEAIRAGGRNAHILLASAVGCSTEGRFDPYVDVDFIMEGTDSMLILTCFTGLQTNILYAHRDACLDILERADVALPAKRAMLRRIAADVGRNWFGGREALLLFLRSKGHPELRELAEQLAEQGGREQPATRKAASKPGGPVTKEDPGG